MKTLKQQGWLLLASLLTTLLLTACGGDASTSPDEPVEETAATAAAAAPILDAFGTAPEQGANYGAGVAADAQVLSYPAFVSAFDGLDSLTGVIQGEVLEVCQKKGCWMTIQAAATDASEMTVRFKDYGFFMPKELSGNQVVLEGTAKRRVVPVDELQHYAEDAGKTEAEIAAITEPKEELEFIATGVRVL